MVPLGRFPRHRRPRRGGHGRPWRSPGSAPQEGGPSIDLNRVFLSGVLAADPQWDRGRDGEPVALLLVAFPAPDAKETEAGVETACCEVEVPAALAERRAEELRAGAPIFVAGRVSGGGGLIADELHAGPSLDPPSRD